MSDLDLVRQRGRRPPYLARAIAPQLNGLDGACPGSVGRARRQAGEEGKRLSYLPPDKQFLMTKKGAGRAFGRYRHAGAEPALTPCVRSCAARSRALSAVHAPRQGHGVHGGRRARRRDRRRRRGGVDHDAQQPRRCVLRARDPRSPCHRPGSRAPPQPHAVLSCGRGPTAKAEVAAEVAVEVPQSNAAAPEEDDEVDLDKYDGRRLGAACTCVALTRPCRTVDFLRGA